MTVKLNHTIVHSRDSAAAADFYSAVFALPAPVRFRPFLDVEVANEVTLAFLPAGDMEVQTQHYAFLVSEAEFDQIFARVKERGCPIGRTRPRATRTRSTTMMAGAACTSTTRAAICWKSSPVPTAVAG